MTAPVSQVLSEAEEGIAAYDAVVRACPANKQFLGDRLCPKCKAGPDEGCREENRAAYAFVSNMRAALAKEQGR